MTSNPERYERPAQRDVLKLAGGVAGAALAAPALYGHHHPKPSPRSLSLIDAGAATGLYIFSTPAMGKPVLGPMPVREWPLPQLNVGAPS